MEIVKLKFVPKLTSPKVAFTLVFGLVLTIVVYFLYTIYETPVILIYSGIFALLISIILFFINNGYFLELNTQQKTIQIDRPFSNKKVNVMEIKNMSLNENKRSYELEFTHGGKDYSFILAAGFDFSEQPVAEFLKKVRDTNPSIMFDENSENIINGDLIFNSWSTKMYFSFWEYFVMFLGVYIFSLAAIFFISR